MTVDIAAHTPGPWRVDQEEGRTEVLTSDGICIAQAIDPHTAHERALLSWDEVQANRRLIAAAPELLWELKAILRDMEREDQRSPEHATTGCNAHRHTHDIRKLIAKAEGRES